MKSQASIETLIMVGIGLLILIPLIIYGNKLLVGQKDDSRISIAKDTVQKIGETANWVFSQGSPARVTIEVYMPDNVESYSLNNRTVSLLLKTSSGGKEMFYITVPELQGELPNTPGYHSLLIQAFKDYVDISVVR